MQEQKKEMYEINSGTHPFQLPCTMVLANPVHAGIQQHLLVWFQQLGGDQWHYTSKLLISANGRRPVTLHIKTADFSKWEAPSDTTHQNCSDTTHQHCSDTTNQNCSDTTHQNCSDTTHQNCSDTTNQLQWHYTSKLQWHYTSKLQWHYKSTAVTLQIKTAVRLHIKTAVTLHIKTAETLHINTAVTLQINTAVTLHIKTAVTLHIKTAELRMQHLNSSFWREAKWYHSYHSHFLSFFGEAPVMGRSP